MTTRDRISTASLTVSGLSVVLATLCVIGFIGVLAAPTTGFSVLLYPSWIVLCVMRMLDPIVRVATQVPRPGLSVTLALFAMAGAFVSFSAGPGDYGVGYLLVPIALVVLVGTYVQFVTDTDRARG